MAKIRFLNNNGIKLLAAALMLVDHIGYMLFPSVTILRIIGRVSYPLFAFMIAEGCRYTKNRKTHFALLFTLAVFCQVFYYYFDNHNTYMSILVTFSLSVLLIYALDWVKKSLFCHNVKVFEKALSVLFFAACVFGVLALNQAFTIDYGVMGTMVPVIVGATYFNGTDIEGEKWVKLIDNHFTRVILLSGALVLLSVLSPFNKGGMNIEFFSLIAAPILLLYNGEKGKLNLKYFFYVFYPLHLGILGLIEMFL